MTPNKATVVKIEAIPAPKIKVLLLIPNGLTFDQNRSKSKRPI